MFSSKTSTLVTESKSTPAEEEKQSSIEVNLLMGGAKHHYKQNIIHKVGISRAIGAGPAGAAAAGPKFGAPTKKKWLQQIVFQQI